MANCNARIFTGRDTATVAATFIETVDDTKFLGLTSYWEGGSPVIIVVYKT